MFELYKRFAYEALVSSRRFLARLWRSLRKPTDLPQKKQGQRFAERRSRQDLSIAALLINSQMQLKRMDEARRVERVFSIATLVVVFVGTLLPTFLGWWGVPPTEPSNNVVVTAPVLEELVRSIQSQQAEFMRMLLPSAAVIPGASDVVRVSPDIGAFAWLGWGWLVVASGFFLACLYIVARASSPAFRLAAVAVATATTSMVAVPAGLNLFKGGSLLKIEHVHLEVPEFRRRPVDQNKGGKFEPKIEAKSPIELSIEINVTQEKVELVHAGANSKVEFHCELDNRALQVGPFVSGEPAELEKTNDTQTVEDLVRKIGAVRKGKEVIGLVLIGSADKTPLTAKTRGLYDSNLALAQLRAQGVEARLKAELATNPKHPDLAGLSAIMTLNAGPTNVSSALGLGDKRLSGDRTVRVCVIVQTPTPAAPAGK